MKLLPYLLFLDLATAAVLPAGGPTKDPVRRPEEKFQHAKEQCNRLIGKRREVCLRSLHDDRAPPLVLITKGHSKRDESDDEDGSGRKKMLVNVSPDGEKFIDVKNEKRGIEVKADDDGVVDLAIPVKVSSPANTGAWNQNQVVQSEYQQRPEQQRSNADDFAAPTSFFPPRTTLQTIPSPTPTSPQGHFPPIEIDNAITFAPTTTYPVQRTLQTTTLANGTELRIEQTESDVHDVHVEETEHQKGAPEEDKVVVHVKVFVEHLRQQAERGMSMVKRGLGLATRDVHAADAAQKEAYCNKLCKIFMMCSCSKEEYKEGAEFWIGDLDGGARKVKERDVEAKEEVQAAEKVAAPAKAAYCNTLCKIFFMCDCTHEEQMEGARWWWPGIDDKSGKLAKKKRDVEATQDVQAADQAAAPAKAAHCNKLCKIFSMCDCTHEEQMERVKWWLPGTWEDSAKMVKKRAVEAAREVLSLDVEQAANREVAAKDNTDVQEQRGGGNPFNCHCEWLIFCFCGTAHDPHEDDHDRAAVVAGRDVAAIETTDVDLSQDVSAADAQTTAPNGYPWDNCKLSCQINPWCDCAKHQKHQHNGRERRGVVASEAVQSAEDDRDANAVTAAQDKDPWSKKNCKLWCWLNVFCDCTKHQKEFDNHDTDEHFPGDDD